jgi:thioredoxin-related protein
VNRQLLAPLLIVAVAAVAAVLKRRRAAQAPTQPDGWHAPQQLDRRDFDRPDHEWLVVVFSSASCQACQSMVTKARVLDSPKVAVQEVEYSANKSLHQRYRIDAVPTTLVADRAGIVRASFHGPLSATDLWAAVADAREPGSAPRHCQGEGRQEHDAHDHDAHDHDAHDHDA